MRGATDTSFTTQVGELGVLPSIRYCITLDSDTRLPRDAAKRLIGIIAHPLNQPHFDRRLGRVTMGYGILQPRVSVTMASAAGSLFARIYAGHTGVDPYTTAVSDVYQDLFDEGIFTGKGLYDVDAFAAALEGRVPENALLSHDLFEGLYARTALVSDVEVVDDYPSSVLAHARRQHRWVRGDWQILWWLFPFVPSRTGARRNRLPLIARWKILDNLRRSLLPPATLLLLVLGWTVLPGHPAVWTAVALAPLALSVPVSRARNAARSGGEHSRGAVFLRMTTGGPEDCRRAVRPAARLHRQRGVRAAARHRDHADPSRRDPSPPAGVGNDGGERGAWRHRAAARIRQRHDGESVAGPGESRDRDGRASGGACRSRRRSWGCGLPPRGSRVALSRPMPRRRTPLSPADRAYLHEIARRTWAYFDAFVGAEDNFLPPDNVQVSLATDPGPDHRETESPTVAHRTSPTNIGLGLLATLAAHDLEFIDTTDWFAGSTRR